MRNFSWGAVAFWLAAVALVGGVVYWVVGDYRGYRTACWDNGGHIEEIRNQDICIDSEGRVLYVDPWSGQVTRRSE